jgi:ATP-binding cassette subfamily B protein
MAETNPAERIAARSALSVLLSLMPFLRPYRWRVAAAAVALLVAAAAALAIPLAFRQMIDLGFASRQVGEQVARGASEVNAAFIGLFAVATVLGIGTAVRFYFVSWLGERVTSDLRNAVYRQVLRQDPTFFESLKSGEVLSRLTADTTLIQTLIGTSISMGLRNTLLFLGGILMLVVTSPKLATMIIALLLLVTLPIVVFGRRVRKLSRASQDRVADSSALAGETLNAIQIVQAYAREPFEARRFVDTTEAAFRAAVRRIRARSLLTALAIVLVFGAIVYVLWLGAHAVIEGRTSAGLLTQFILYAAMVAGAAGALAEVLGDVQRAAGATERLLELLNAQPRIQGPQATARAAAGPVAGDLEPVSTQAGLTEAASSGAASPEVASTRAAATGAASISAASTSAASTGTPSPRGASLVLEQVRFSYPSRPAEHALADVTLRIGAGETVALVGPSGAGKTTVFQLLLRFYDPQQGRILLDGADIRDMDLAALRGRIGLVSQDSVVFSADVMENIRYGRLEATDDEVIAAARAAHADEFVRRLPEGYRTYVGERGVRLSGGQRQRIAIARALLKNPPLLLLDEATSALDAESEQLVQQALEEAMQGRTTLVIAHRLATVVGADRIVVLERGAVIDQGSHAELLTRGGLYAKLAGMQFNA